jgi:adenylyltransferase/sulfurtransferase
VPQLAARLKASGELGDVLANRFLLRFTAPGGDESQRLQVTLFADGRAIVKGTKNVAEARGVYAKYIGS